MSNKKRVICIKSTVRQTGQHLVEGDIYTIEDNRGSPETCEVTDMNGVSQGSWFTSRFEEVDEYEPPHPKKDDKGEFILWSPESDKVPTKRYYTYKQARYVARSMLEAHGGTWYVLRAECKYTSKCEVIKEEL